MPETLVDKQICNDCGTVVRDGSAFCYNCGGSVERDQAADHAPPPPIGRPSSNFANGKEQRSIKTEVFESPIPPPAVSPTLTETMPAAAPGVTETMPASEPGVAEAFVEEEEPKPSTAFPTASRRERPRLRAKKQKEIEWVEHGSSALFVISAILLAIVVGLLLAAAFYMR